MFKKILVSTTALMVLVATLGFSAFAYSVADRAQRIVDDANDQIVMVVELAQMTRYDDAAFAKFVTDIIADNAIDRLEAMGVDADCTYTLYIIDGHEVLIDPIIIIKF